MLTHSLRNSEHLCAFIDQLGFPLSQPSGGISSIWPTPCSCALRVTIASVAPYSRFNCCFKTSCMNGIR